MYKLHKANIKKRKNKTNKHTMKIEFASVPVFEILLTLKYIFFF